MKGGPPRRQRRGGGALDDDPVGRDVHQNGIEPFDEPRGQRIERLLRRHDFKIEIGAKREEFEDGTDQIAMLASDAHMASDVAFVPESPQQRCKFDRFRTRAEHRK